jgi:hypothetical protein
VNKIGRRQVSKYGDVVTITYFGLMSAQDLGSVAAEVRDRLNHKLASLQGQVQGRWLSWRPISEVTYLSFPRGSSDDPLSPDERMGATQMWEARFVGRRKRPRR